MHIMLTSLIVDVLDSDAFKIGNYRLGNEVRDSEPGSNIFTSIHRVPGRSSSSIHHYKLLCLANTSSYSAIEVPSQTPNSYRDS
jgi:hypothetical protein